MWHTTPANGATVPWRLGPVPGNICSSTTAERPGDAARWLKLALVCELDTWSCVSCRVVSHCITPRPRLSSPTGSCQLHRNASHRTATQRTSHSHSTAQAHTGTTTLYLHSSRRAASVRPVAICAHTLTPCVSPGFKGSQAGGAAAEPTSPPPSLSLSLSLSLPPLPW